LTVFLDVSLLVRRLLRSTPVGIDRVEFAYARELFLERDPKDRFGVLATPWISGALEGARVAPVLKSIETAWGANAAAKDDPAYCDVRKWLETPIDEEASAAKRYSSVRSTRLTSQDWTRLPYADVISANARLKRAAHASGERGALLDVAHLKMHSGASLRWAEEAGVRRVFMVHDMLPMQLPEYFQPGRDLRHQVRMKHLLPRASMIVAVSQATADAIADAAKEHGWRAPPILVNPLGVDPVFLDREKLDPPRPKVPYFVCVGTIEPRKNLGLLLLAWRRMAETLGGATPRLVVVGRRGWENENIIDLLERSQRLGPYVAEVADITDQGLASLMAGASAVIAPSHGEGFGLPIVEALAVGAPVIASDISVHREVAGALAIYVDPVDGAGWMRAVVAAAAPTERPRPAYAARTWSMHVTQTLEALGVRP
jgi:glycosyltransferase involved in cell wall biosynthesis